MSPNLKITDLDPPGINQGNHLALGNTQWPERENALPQGE